MRYEGLQILKIKYILNVNQFTLSLSHSPVKFIDSFSEDMKSSEPLKALKMQDFLELLVVRSSGMKLHVVIIGTDQNNLCFFTLNEQYMPLTAYMFFKSVLE